MNRRESRVLARRTAAPTLQPRSREAPPRAGLRAQKGAVLVVALVILGVLTLIGIASIGTTTLEERMSANEQERSRAFQAAESGVAAAFRNNAVFTSSGTDAPQVSTIGDSGTRQSYSVVREACTNPPAGILTSATRSFKYSHFQITSDGTTDGGARATVSAGVRKLGAGC